MGGLGAEAAGAAMRDEAKHASSFASAIERGLLDRTDSVERAGNSSDRYSRAGRDLFDRGGPEARRDARFRGRRRARHIAVTGYTYCGTLSQHYGNVNEPTNSFSSRISLGGGHRLLPDRGIPAQIGRAHV